MKNPPEDLGSLSEEGEVRSIDEPTGSRSPSTKRPDKITIPWVRRTRRRCEPLVMVTAYDAQQARTVDAAGVDLVLVGDSVAMVVLGYEDTLSVTMEEMLHHVKAVRRGLQRALLVADMPYGSFHRSSEQAVENAMSFVKKGGAQAVKIEGARPEVIRALVEAEIPTMAHLGLTPQSLHKFGGFKVQGKTGRAKKALVEAAQACEQAGAFSLVLECVPSAVAAAVREAVTIPTIGIGAGPDCDGQVLVYHDLLGLEDRVAPKFVRRYADLGNDAREAVAQYAEDVRRGRFPDSSESYGVRKDGSGSDEVPGIERIYG